LSLNSHRGEKQRRNRLIEEGYGEDEEEEKVREVKKRRWWWWVCLWSNVKKIGNEEWQ